MEENCLPEEVSKISIPDFDEIRRSILRICLKRVGMPKKIKRKSFKYVIKADMINDYITSRLLSNLKALPYDKIEGFYLEIIKLASLDSFKEDVKELNKGVRLANMLWREYRVKLKNALDYRDARNLFREYVGRTLSIFSRLRRELNTLREVVHLLSRTPCIDSKIPSIVIAGMPQTGKSTFVNKVSTAKSKVSPFPFTTKDVILGHAEVDGIRIQVIDTPGILDRPFDELNVIERKAYAAIKYLANYILFFIDPSENAYYSLESQLKLLSNITNEFGTSNLAIVINKIDLVSKDRLNTVKELLGKVINYVPIFEISALHGVGIYEVLNYVVSYLRSNSSTRIKSSEK